MIFGQRGKTYICNDCLRGRLITHGTSRHNLRSLHISSHLPQKTHTARVLDAGQKETRPSSGKVETEKGRFSERLEQMTEDTLEQTGPRASKTIEEAGFSKELRDRLEAKIEAAQFRHENPRAFSQVGMPPSAGKGTQAIASAEPWTGEERLAETALRMLDDAHKPLRRPVRIPQPRAVIDTRIKRASRKSAGERLANARDQTTAYALSQGMTEQEQDEYRKQLQDRFTSNARPMPATVQGLQALANERIEDAIARGQFKNIPRGKGTNTEGDHNVSSPFLDTTEYFMNKMIKKQDIVPPWIEKQQELVKMANIFRSRLRSDWRRHAARSIGSKGGSVQSQVERANAFAQAEAAINPKRSKIEAISGFDEEGKLSQVTMMETLTPDDQNQDAKISVSEDLAKDAPNMAIEPAPPGPASLTPLGHADVFRDPDWEAIERSYHELSITNLNNLTRSYNLQAPDLAKKPYFSLSRELRICYADVAPQLADEIQERARKPKIRVEVIGHKPGGVLERFTREKVKVYDERKPQYGFKQFWRDLWASA